MDDKGPQLNAVGWALISFSALFLCLRLYCKYTKNRELAWDDYVLIAAWCALLADVIVVTIMIKHGYGKHVYDLEPENLAAMGIMGNLVATFSIVAAAWSKTSFAITLLRVTKQWTKWFTWFAIVSINVSLGLSALFTWVRCSPVSKTWLYDVPGTCWDNSVSVNYGIFSGVYSGVMDIALALLPWKVIWGLDIQRKEKIGVALAMSMGVFAGATAFLKTSTIPTLGSEDFSYDVAPLVLWGYAEAATTIMAASIPVLRVLIRETKSFATLNYSSSKGETQKSELSRNGNGPILTTRVTSRAGRATVRDGSSEMSILGPEMTDGTVEFVRSK